MSQAYLNAVYQGRPVQVMAGRDGIEWHLFAKVAWLDADGEWIEPLVLDVWRVIDERSTLNDARDYVTALACRVARLGIEMPTPMRAEICRAMLDDDNRTQVWFDAAGHEVPTTQEETR